MRTGASDVTDVTAREVPPRSFTGGHAVHGTPHHRKTPRWASGPMSAQGINSGGSLERKCSDESRAAAFTGRAYEGRRTQVILTATCKRVFLFFLDVSWDWQVGHSYAGRDVGGRRSGNLDHL